MAGESEASIAATLGGSISFDRDELFIETLEANPHMLYFSNSRKSWLHSAVSHGRTRLIDYLLDKGFNVNLAVNIEQTTPLDSAVLADAIPHRVDMVRTLLARGADPNISRPLIYALNSRRGSEEIGLELVRLLVEGGADVNRVYDIYGEADNTFTALEWADGTGWRSVADYLRSKGAVDRPDRPAPAPPPKKRKRG